MHTTSTASIPQFTLPTTTCPAGQQRTADQAARVVLHVINGEHFSGAERVQQLLGKRLSDFGFEPLFACVKPGQFPSTCGLRPDQIHETPMRWRWDLGVVSKLARLASWAKVDLLHAHTPRTALVTSMVARRLSLPWLYHVHSPTARDSTRGFVNRINALVERHAIRNSDLVLTVSESLKREMLDRGVTPKRLVVVPNGVPAIEPINPDERQDRQGWKIGLLALMRPRKGVEDALSSMQLIRDQGLPIRLDLIGAFETPEYQACILQKIDDMGLQSVVRWRGFTNEVAVAIRELDALLLPSLFGEGMPMVVLEAISAGVPVIATNVEGTPEVIRDGREGFLAEPGNPQSLTEKLKLLTSSRMEWKRLSHQALARHRGSFSDLRMAETVAKAYTRVRVDRSASNAGCR